MNLRFAILLAPWVLLLVVTLVAYTQRFRVVEGSPALSLSDMRLVASDSRGAKWSPEHSDLHLEKIKGGLNVIATLECPGLKGVDGIHLSYKITVKELVKGPKDWQVGRMGISWVSNDGKRVTEPRMIQYFIGNQEIAVRSRVMMPDENVGAPRIVIQNIADSGLIEIKDLEIKPVVQRGYWPWLRVLFYAITCTLTIASFHLLVRRGLVRSFVASVICLSMLEVFIVPDVMDVRPEVWGMVYDLEYGEPGLQSVVDVSSSVKESSLPSDAVEVGAETGDAISSAPDHQAPVAVNPHENHAGKTEPERVERLNSKDGLLWWARDHLEDYLFLLHIIVFFAPVFILCSVSGVSCAGVAGSVLAIGAEWSQAFFGDGWHVDDYYDVCFNLLGVLLGIVIWKFSTPKIIRLIPEKYHPLVDAG